MDIMSDDDIQKEFKMTLSSDNVIINELHLLLPGNKLRMLLKEFDKDPEIQVIAFQVVST